MGGYILKNTSALINTRLTDVGRRKMSQGNFNISYFQIGDSEVDYSGITNLTNYNILEPAFNAQNDTGTPQSNKHQVKYPLFVNGTSGSTFGIPFMDSVIESVYNSAAPKGFFTGSTGAWTAFTSSAYTITSNFNVDLSTISGGSAIDIFSASTTTCDTFTGTPSVGDLITIFYDSNGGCGDVRNSYPTLTYKIQDITTGTSATTTYTVTLDRPTPNFVDMGLGTGEAKCLVYPSGMTVIYDTETPAPQWSTDAINFQTTCDVPQRDVPVWNMNIPWSENIAGVFTSTYEGIGNYGSQNYLGSKEYFGYGVSGGTVDTSSTYYYNSFDELITVLPSEQKTIAIVHYTNQMIDFVYGEKFATQPIDPSNPVNTTGNARNFKVDIPWLMWHKSTGTTIGESFYIDPPGYELLIPYYIKSRKNTNFNDPGMRYFHLYDLNPDDNGNLNRVGKVFPDQHIIIFDDEEIVAALSYKANRNWTLPAPKLSLITPNVCDFDNQTADGVMSADTETMFVTWRFDSTGFTESLHCNYYSKIIGPSTGCTDTSQNVSVRFGEEFPFLSQSSLSGFSANSVKLICQKVTGSTRPTSTGWKQIDVSSGITATSVNNFITESGMTGTTFIITKEAYDNASSYNLANYLTLPQNNDTSQLQFGDEYYFYGNVESDIQATIYEMRYKINLASTQFTSSSNPTFTTGGTPYITEVGLFDADLDLMVVSKIQAPFKRQGTQQILIKLDF